MTSKYEYQVALSFAGEERQYVEKVARHLKHLGIQVFYDEFEQTDLWGKDLYSHLDDVYRNKTRYCVLFISEAYRKKLWTNHERESAQARAFEENREYILPARFDDTQIPGLRSTTGYIDLHNFTPQQFAELIAQKVNNSNFSKSSYDFDTATFPKSQTKTKTTSKLSKPSREKTKSLSSNPRPSIPRTKTVNFNKEGISKLPNDRPVVYKILTEGGQNNFTGAAKRGEVQKRILEHLSDGKKRVPGSKVQIERMDSIDKAEEKAERIIKRTNPKYNVNNRSKSK
jgi:TIR domain